MKPSAATPTFTPTPVSGISGIAENANKLWQSMNKTWNDFKATALERKVWFEKQLEVVEKNDATLHAVAMTVFAAILATGIGPLAAFSYAAIGYGADSWRHDDVKNAIRHVNDVWLKTKTAKVVCAAAGLLLVPTYGYPIASVLFGVYLSHVYTPPKQNVSKEPVEANDALPAIPERIHTLKHIKYWPLWDYVLPNWFGQKTAPQTNVNVMPPNQEETSGG